MRKYGFKKDLPAFLHAYCFMFISLTIIIMIIIIPIVIGAIASISKRAKTWYDKLGVPEFIGSLQLSAILGTAHLLRKVLCF